MNADDESSPKKRADKASPDAVTVSVDKTDVKKIEKSDSEDPKPRIVLTFRSEKSNTKTSNMKIVSNEEKAEEVSPRRSSRTRVCVSVVCDSDTSVSPKKDKSQPVSENDESDSSHVTTKRTRRRSRDENIIATAIARKEKSYNETTPGPTQRLSRRIKPTAKVLANEELRIGVESQNHARLGLSDKSPVRTRRSARPSNPERKPVEKPLLVDEVVELDGDSQDSDMKLQHLCKLGLKAIEVEDSVETGNKDLEESEQLEDEEEEVDDDSEVISKLLEADEDSGSDEEFYCSVDASARSGTRRRPTRRCWSYFKSGNDRSSPVPDDDKTPSRRSSRRAAPHGTEDSDRSHRSLRKRKSSGADEVASDQEIEDDSYPADGEEGSEAAEPDEKSTIIANCLCEASSNVYADPDEFTDPVFCQAIEVVDGVRVGCSHSASPACSLRRAGPRAPYFLPCALHAAQLRRHMSCPACGLFCTQGTFYQCSKGHLFHLECGLPYNENKSRPGCPHCGVYSYRWQPVNTDCTKVKVDMQCSNKRIFLPDQREQCTQAYLGFTTTDPDPTPVIPEDLLPPPSILKRLALKKEGGRCTAQELREAILAQDIESFVDKIDAKSANASLPMENGGSCVHVSARRGYVHALYVLHAAGAALDRLDHSMRTPLILATLALVDKISSKEDEIKEDNMEVDPSSDSKDDLVKEEDLLKVIRFLVAAGCDVNCAEQPDQLTALHIAAQHGHTAACSALLQAPHIQVDAKDQGGWTPLVWAAENDHHQVVRLLVEAGADVMSIDKEGNSCVGWSAAAGAARALPILLHKAPQALHRPNTHGDTPLHVAARQGHYACVVILLARGARCDVENSAGELPADVCTGPSHNAIMLNMQMKIAIKDKIIPYKILSSDISKGREMYPIPVINSVDETPAPDDFTYVTSHVTPYPLNVDNTTQTLQLTYVMTAACLMNAGTIEWSPLPQGYDQAAYRLGWDGTIYDWCAIKGRKVFALQWDNGCECEDECSTSRCACVVLGVKSWSRGGRLLPTFPHHDPPMLFDCNLTCNCHHKRCNNNTLTRLLEQGSMFVPARVERVSVSIGWGLASVTHVPRGAPVAVYTGELLALQLADTRTDDTYMFALDVKPDLLEQCTDKTLLCVDARRYGGAARFVNHSCRANLAPVRVFTRTRDLRLPTVALYATRDILPGEHFTFDYGDKFWSVKSKFMRCECGAPDCRYPVKTQDETES